MKSRASSVLVTPCEQVPQGGPVATAGIHLLVGAMIVVGASPFSSSSSSCCLRAVASASDALDAATSSSSGARSHQALPRARRLVSAHEVAESSTPSFRRKP